MKTSRNNVLEQCVTNEQVVQYLIQLQANTYVLYVKTQNFHWNIVGEGFYFLHKMLEEQYEELAEASDMIAERLRAVEKNALGSMRQFLEHTSLEEAENSGYTAMEMIEQLVNDHQAIARELRGWFSEASKKNEDATADLFIERLRAHEKTAWMLRSHLSRG